MARGLNKVMLIGNLGKDVDLRYTPGGAAVANFTLATSESWKDKQSGEMQEKTEWHRCVAWGKSAEIIGEYCKKGSKLYIEGANETRKWTDKQGHDNYTTEIKVREFQFLDSRPAGAGPVPQSGKPVAADQHAGPADDNFDDDIPF